MMEKNKHFDFWICIVLVIATILAYEPLRFNDFVSYDDNVYVTNNPEVKNGLTGKSVLWAFTTGHTGNWHPLTWLSHILDCRIFGLNPLGHHLTNLFFHVLNTVLLFLVFKTMTSRVWPSAFVAAVFAVHPVHVESVAWVAERKDVLSGFFWILTMAAYVRYARRPSLRRYLLVAAAMGLGLMAKPMLVTMPFVLLLLDYWPLERIQWRAEINGGTSQQPPKSVKSFYRRGSFWSLLVEKIPLFCMSGISSVITVIVQHSGGTVVPSAMLSLDVRIANALISYLRYIKKMIYPSRLSVFYPYHSQSLLLAILCFVILVLVTAAVIYFGMRRRYLAAGWFWYIGTLAPVIGIVQVGSQSMADRYTYVPLIGLFIIIAWLACELSAGRRYQKIVLGICSATVVTVLLVGTRMQVRHWQNSSTLFEHALAVTKDNSITHNHYGIFLLEHKRFEQALAQFDEAVRISPRNRDAHKNKGLAYLGMGRFDEGIATFQEMLSAWPDWPDAYYWLGVGYARKGAYEQAVAYFETALRQMPATPLRGESDSAAIYHDLGLAYLLMGKYDLAVRNLKEAVRLDSNYPGAAGNLASAMEEQKKASQKGKQ
jgi:tetratricopeptide (TPR) repeat protein